MQIKKHFPTILVSIIISILLLEFFLFLSGQVFLWQRRTWEQKHADVRIVCLGDSHTFGVGTAAAYAYPQQLEKILNRNNPAVKFSVVNLGIPGSSTQKQEQILEEFFKKNDAQVVLWLTGRNYERDLKQWDDGAVSNRVGSLISRSRSARFLKMSLDRWLGKNPSAQEGFMSVNRQKYAAFLNYYLERGRDLCRRKRAKLIFLSYYNSSSSVIQDYASNRHIPYFDFVDDFKAFSRGWQDTFYISTDDSHMNRYGYKFFSEQVYSNFFLHPAVTGFHINPLLHKIEAKEFYASPQEREKMIATQEARLMQSKGSWTYPFELVGLGHIYDEVGGGATALKYYRDGLVSSNYVDNNAIISPIVNWHLTRGQNDEALKICEEILAHNPANNVAKGYRNFLLKKSPHLSGAK